MTRTAKSPTILLADDDADDRFLAQEAMVECGFNHDLRFVEDGEELLDYLHRRGKWTDPASSPRPGLILLDLNMPRKDGREALAEIKANAQLRRIPIVVMTTSSADEDIQRTYGLGVNSYIVKPLLFDELVGVMWAIGDYWFNTVALPDSRYGV